MIKAHVHGNISCNYSEIEDDFRIDEAQVYGNLSLRHTSLGEFRTNAHPADTSNKNVEYRHASLMAYWTSLPPPSAAISALSV